MALNHYFSQKVPSEQNLYEDIIIESMKIYGQDVYYLPRELVNEDSIFREDVPSKYSSAHKIEMYIENTEGFDGEGDLFTKFGVQIRDAATFIVSRRRWATTVANMSNEIQSIRPREGDLLYLPLTRSLFTISFVEHEQPFYALSNLPTFKLRAELFEYNDENISTGILDIDKVERTGYNLELLLNAGVDSAAAPISADFMDGEFIKQTIGTRILTAEVLQYRQSENIVIVGHVGANDGNYAMFAPGLVTNTRLRNVSAAEAYIGDSGVAVTRTIVSLDENVSGDSSFAQNDIFDTAGSEFTDMNFLDFSETNPFGDPEDI